MIPMRDSITIVRAGEFDDWGRPTNPTTRVLKCRLDYTQQRFTDSKGEERVSKAIVYFKGLADVIPTDTLEWTDELGQFHSVKPSIVSPLKDFTKIVMTKVVI